MGEFRKERAEYLDAARGVAMFFMLLSHFSAVYFRDHPDRFWPTNLYRIGMIASPTFTIVSGLLLGFLFATKTAQFSGIRAKLIDRGLFLLTIGHLLVAGAFWFHDPQIAWSYMRTDSIAVSMIVGALIIGRINAPGRIFLGVSTYLVSWLIVWAWRPGSQVGSEVESVVFGSMTVDNFPFLPWFSLYISSSVLGEWIASRARDTKSFAVGWLGLASSSSVAMAAIISLLKHGAESALSHHPFVNHTLWIGQKYPPGPVYLLFYGGIGLGFVALWMFLDGIRWRGALRTMAVAGQASFFIYVVQYYLFDLIALVRFRPTVAWPFFFGSVCVIIIVAVWFWDALDANRLLTVGVTRVTKQFSPPTRELRPS